jgi:sugar/nucleoside kinase (ribokinase family)
MPNDPSGSTPGQSTHNVLCIGNAIVDILCETPEETIDTLDLSKGAMTLIDDQRADELYRAMGPAIEASGGSAANTAAGIGSLGGKCAFIGKVRDDQFGQVFTHDIRAIGVDFDSLHAVDGPPTARCLIFITPDAQRTMNTYLGACVNLTPADIDKETVEGAEITYMEGYLWDPPSAKEAFVKAAQIAHNAGRKVSLTLSDAFCVDRHRASFRELIRNHVDLLFANESEIASLYEVDDFDACFQHIRADRIVAALTRSEKGSVVVAGDEVHIVDAEPVGDVVDTTGAGDQYAAGFLYGFTHGADHATCGRLGGIAAAEVISHVGPRPQVNLADLAKQKGLL